MNKTAGRRVLFLCTANVCRSPTAEYLARDRFGEEYWRFRSAGFMEHGRAASDTLVQALDEVGIDVRRHRSYRLDPASIAAADLILTMEGAHVRQANEIDPAAYAKTLPLMEAADMLDRWGDTEATVADLLAALRDQRDPGTYLRETWDVDDPYGRSLRIFRRTVEEITELVESVLGRLR